MTADSRPAPPADPLDPDAPLPPLDAAALAALQAETLPPWTKGVAARAVGRPLSALGGLGLSLLDGDLPWPAAVLRASALTHNLAWMQAFTARAGVRLCPHGKTTMAPQLFERQRQAGAWGLTAATAGHVRTYAHFGVRRILLANQLVAASDIDLVFDALQADPALDLYSLVDSLEGLERLQAALARRPLSRPLQLLLEVGLPGGRTGVRTREAGQALGRAVRDAGPGIVLRGVETFEGVVGGPDMARAELAVHTVLDTVAALARDGCAEGWFAPGPVIVSAGGSAFFDMAAAVLGAVPAGQPLQVVLRAGCTLTHDSLHYARMQDRMRERSGERWGRGEGLRAALEVWTVVQSVPEPGRAICALGKRDISHDIGLPQPLWWHRPGQHDRPQPAPAGWRVSALNDQHAYLDLADDAPTPAVGDLVGFGIGHPCTTFDRWSLLHVIDDDGRVVEGIRTFF